VLTLLVKAGAPVDALDTEGGATALFQAASFGRTEAVETLLSLGADPAKPSRSGQTPRQAALANGHTRIAELLAAVKISRP